MKNLDEIRWGILGCGDVCEVKSGPAFNKVSHSRLVAVMRRNREKAEDFAMRHNVPKFFSDANALIDDNEINAIYIATPPANHEDLAIRCMEAGKPVYIEKPVTLTSASCGRMRNVSQTLDMKASVAHYRRGLPIFRKIRSLVHSGAIGKPGLIMVNTLKTPSEDMKAPDYWRTTPEISGGGLFFDLAPHQLDIFYWIFGKATKVQGLSLNQKKVYPAADLTTIQAVYGDDIFLHGIWAFNVPPGSEIETCDIIGDKGKITFSFFRASSIQITTANGTENLTLEYPENIQQPMIDDVVKFFRGEGPNPCSLDDALTTLQMMESTR